MTASALSESPEASNSRNPVLELKALTRRFRAFTAVDTLDLMVQALERTQMTAFLPG